MLETIIYHNPACSKSREALALLESQGRKPTIIHYLETSFTHKSLSHLLQMLNMPPRKLLRSKEALYQTLQLDNPNLTDAELIEAMIMHPKLIERPIVVHQGKAIIARPIELVLSLFSELQ